MRLRWLIAALLLSAALAYANGRALSEYLYWRYVWIDIPMHFLGGVSIAVLSVGVLGRFRPWLFAAAVAAAFVGWEVFEYVFGTSKETNYAFDTALDLLMDTLGAVSVYAVARFTAWKKKA